MIFLYWNKGEEGEFITRGETVEKAYYNMKGILYDFPDLSQCEVFSTEPIKAKMTMTWETEVSFFEAKPLLKKIKNKKGAIK